MNTITISGIITHQEQRMFLYVVDYKGSGAFLPLDSTKDLRGFEDTSVIITGYLSNLAGNPSSGKSISLIAVGIVPTPGICNAEGYLDPKLQVNAVDGIFTATTSPEIRFFENGNAVTKVASTFGNNVAVRLESWSNPESRYKPGEILANYVHQGDRFGGTGKLVFSAYQQKTYFSISISSVELLGKRPTSETLVPATASVGNVDNRDDIPF